MRHPIRLDLDNYAAVTFFLGYDKSLMASHGPAQKVQSVMGAPALDFDMRCHTFFLSNGQVLRHVPVMHLHMRTHGC